MGSQWTEVNKGFLPLGKKKSLAVLQEVHPGGSHILEDQSSAECNITRFISGYTLYND